MINELIWSVYLMKFFLKEWIYAGVFFLFYYSLLKIYERLCFQKVGIFDERCFAIQWFFKYLIVKNTQTIFLISEKPHRRVHIWRLKVNPVIIFKHFHQHTCPHIFLFEWESDKYNVFIIIFFNVEIFP